MLRACLQEMAKYPTSKEARLQKPQGNVAIRLTLSRDGTVTAVSVEKSAGSIILDQAALATARRAQCGAFPDGTWVGASEHVFTAIIEFVSQ